MIEFPTEGGAWWAKPVQSTMMSGTAQAAVGSARLATRNVPRWLRGGINMAFYRSFKTFTESKLFKTIGGYRGIAPGIGVGITIGLLTAGNYLGKNIFNAVRRPPPQRIGHGISGPGFITFSKTRGMPHNHLSTEGLSLALHGLRHTSQL